MSSSEGESGLGQRLRRRGEQTLARARELLSSGDWRFAGETRATGDVVEWVTVPGMGRVFLLTAVYNSSIERVWSALCDDVEKLPKWCKVFTAAHILTTVDSQTDVLYHETQSAGGGIVSPRDWITLRHWEIESEWFQQAAVAVDYPLKEHKRNMVRGETVISLYSVSKVPAPAPGASDVAGAAAGAEAEAPAGEGELCRLQFMSCCNMGGWLPMKVIDRFYIASCLKLAADLRQHLQK